MVPFSLNAAFVALLLTGATASTVFASPAPEHPEQPRFSRHIVPLFSRLGCNAGTCHGAVQGKNGFRLSLFGADPAADYGRLLREYGGRRVNLAEPEASLLLQKASGQVPHKGGKLLDVGSPSYQLLLSWLQRGAPLDDITKSRLLNLEVEPSRYTGQVGQSYPLLVRARFADGSVEDATPFATFESRDPTVAAVDRNGRVMLQGVGGARLVVRFRGEPVGAQALVAATANGQSPQVPEHNFIDRHVQARLRELQLPPADLCDDFSFLRRARLDVTGLLPTPDEILAFAADTDPQKRGKKIEQLLADPGHAAVWATKFCDLYKPQFPNDKAVVGRFPALLAPHTRRFYEWIRARVAENIPYDEFVERIVLATTAEGRTPEEVLEEFRQFAIEDLDQSTDLTSYVRRRTLDTFWMRQDATGVPGAVQFGHAFLGLRLACAQCHRHPTDVWQQDDLLSFANFFTRVGKLPDARTTEEIKKQNDEFAQVEKQIVQLRSQAMNSKISKEAKDKLLAEAAQLAHSDPGLRSRVTNYRNFYMVTGAVEKPSFAKVSSGLGTQESKQFRLLADAKPVTVGSKEDPRTALMAWLRRPDNPFFARAMVNRVWAHYFGRGIVDPPDDLSPLNPPTHPELLQELSDSFVRNKYDLRWLHRTILTSRTYQQSNIAASEAGQADVANYARFPARRMSPEMIIDAINHATGGQETYPAYLHVPAGARAMEVPGNAHYGAARASLDYAFTLFGRARREPSTQCDCESGTTPVPEQGLYMAAHGDVLKKIADPNGRAAGWGKLADADRQIEEAFLWSLSRRPTDGERRALGELLKKSPTPQRRMEDLLWVLLNHRDFLLIR